MCVCVCVYALACGCVQDFGSVFTLHYLQEIFFGIFKRENLFLFSGGKGLLWKKGTIRCVCVVWKILNARVQYFCF